MSDAKRKEKVLLNNKPVIEIEHSSYQPSKAELEEEVYLNTTPDELGKAVMRDVTVVTKPRKPRRIRK